MANKIIAVPMANFLLHQYYWISNQKLILLLFSLVIFSCKQENKLKQNNKSKSQVNKEQLIEYKFDFPDTVFINEKYNGIIDYKSILDTITTSFDDKKIVDMYFSYCLFQKKNLIMILSI